jgi:hypothetical protein
MPKYMALLYGAPENDQQQISEDESSKFMEEWARWAQVNQDRIVDQGAPLGSTKRLMASGTTDAKNWIVAYCIVEAVDHAAAASMFADHPHLRLSKGNAIEVLEGLDVPPSPSRTSST